MEPVALVVVRAAAVPVGLAPVRVGRPVAPVALEPAVLVLVVQQAVRALVRLARAPVVPAQGRAVAAARVGMEAAAVERVAPKCWMRSCAARRPCISPLHKMYLSRCGSSVDSATALVNLAASSSKPS